MSPQVWAYVILMLLVLAVLSVRLFPGAIYRAAMRLERRLARLKTNAVTLSNGIRMVYNDGGHGDALVLLHGFTADKDHWNRIARLLTPQLRVIAPDLPGFGASSREDALDYSVENQLSWLEDFIATLRLDRVHLGGSSMGGALAAHYAARHPRQVQSLWLLAPAGVTTRAQSEMTQTLTRGGDHPLVPQSRKQFDETLDFVFSRPPFLPRSVRRYLATEAIGRAALHQKIFRDLLDESQSAFTPLLDAAVDGLRTPTLVVWGSADRVLHPDGAQILAGLMPAAQVRIMRDVGHLPMLEAPKQTAEDYLAFVAPMQTDGRSR